MRHRERKQIRIRFLGKMLLGVALVASGSRASVAADVSVISGQARNRTRSQPAAGDEVILLRAEHGMQEEARTQTDARGSFTLKLRDSDKLYLLRVVHQGVNHEQRAAPGDSASVDVFDTAVKVEGISGTIEVIRAGAVGKQLHVSDMIEIRNQSSPPLTQAGERTFDVYLPADAKIISVLAAGPENLAVMTSAAHVPGDSGRYSVSFPLRPGATKFAFNYDLPYQGHATFPTTHAYPLQQLAVMIPPTMKFSSPSKAFKILKTGNRNYEVRAISPLKGFGPRL
jgi:hypothetical protein